jgi:predicted phage-related endonuclease
VYLAKRGEPNNLDSLPLRFGTFNEPFVLSEFTRETGRQVSNFQKHFRHPEFTFIGATVDGISDGAVVEAKTTSLGFDTLPDHIEVQVQEQLACAGMELAFVPVLMRGRDFKIFEVQADADLQEMILERMARLWLRVQEGDPPPPMSPGDVRRLFPVDKGSELVADQTLVEAAQKLREIKTNLASLADQKAVLETSIQGEMGEHAVLADSDGHVIATWKTTKASSRFDAKVFKAAQPDVYAEFCKPVNGSRRFILK